MSTQKTATRNSDRNATAHVYADDQEFKHHLLETLQEIRDGNFKARVTMRRGGVDDRIAETLNQIGTRMERFNVGLLRLRHQVGEEGRITERMASGDAVGNWA